MMRQLCECSIPSDVPSCNKLLISCYLKQISNVIWECTCILKVSNISPLMYNDHLVKFVKYCVNKDTILIILLVFLFASP